MTNLNIKITQLNLLELPTFEKWLENHVTDSYIGFTCSSGRCPIAHYLRNSLNDEFIVYAFPDEISFHKDNRLAGDFIPPKWIRLFMDKVDNIGFVYNNAKYYLHKATTPDIQYITDNQVSVAPLTALYILQQVKEKMLNASRTIAND